MKVVEYLPKEAVLRTLVEVSALVILGVFVGRFFWMVIAPQAHVAAITPSPNLPNVSLSDSASTPVDKSILLRINAFEEPDTVTATPTLDEVPETSLNLVLKGQRAVTGDGLGTATIVTPDNRQSVYEEGEEILEGVVLSRVLSDRVILEKDGRFESLFWEGRDGALNVLGTEETPRQTIANQEAVKVSTFRVDNLNALRGAFRFNRVTAPPGWRFRAVGDPGVLRSAGIYDGDYLVAVDGAAATDLDLTALVSQFDSTERMNLTVRRGSETLAITLVFEEPLQ